MFLLNVAAAIGLATTPSQVSISHAEFCEKSDWRRHFSDPDLGCTAAINGIAIGPADESELFSIKIDESASLFTSNFKQPTAPVALIGSPTLSADQTQFLTRNGFLPFPWLSSAMRAELRTSAIRRQVEKTAAALPPAKRKELIEIAITQVHGMASGKSHDIEHGALAHELAHLWFKNYFDAGRTSNRAVRQYGSSANDWLDETAAVLSEDENVTAARRKSVINLLDPESGKLKVDLKTFLAKGHPSLDAAVDFIKANQSERSNQAERPRRMLSKDEIEKLRQTNDGALTSKSTFNASQTSSMYVLTGEEAKSFVAASEGGDPIAFYVQARSFADFMIETSQRTDIFADLAEHIRLDGDLPSWLAVSGKENGLPVDIDELSDLYEQWVRDAAELA